MKRLLLFIQLQKSQVLGQLNLDSSILHRNHFFLEPAHVQVFGFLIQLIVLIENFESPSSHHGYGCGTVGECEILGALVGRADIVGVCEVVGGDDGDLDFTLDGVEDLAMDGVEDKLIDGVDDGFTDGDGVCTVF